MRSITFPFKNAIERIHPFITNQFKDNVEVEIDEINQEVTLSATNAGTTIIMTESPSLYIMSNAYINKYLTINTTTMRCMDCTTTTLEYISAYTYHSQYTKLISMDEYDELCETPTLWISDLLDTL